MHTTRVGIVGCGYFGNFHLDILNKMEQVEVCALAAGNTQRLVETGKKAPGARLYADHHEMLDREQLDALFVCVTPARHDDIERYAAQKGVHLYVEKPIGLSMDEVSATADAIERAGILCSVGYQERYSCGMDAVKALLAKTQAGLVAGRWVGGMPAPLWWRQKDQSGGQIVEQCTHIFDALRFLFGEAQSIYTAAQKGLVTGVPSYDVEDCSTSTVLFQSGVTACVQTGCYCKSTFEAGFDIYLPDEKIEYVWGQCMRRRAGNHVDTLPFEAEPHAEAVRAFINAVQHRDAAPIRSSYRDAAKTLALTLSANESMRTGKPVAL